MQKPSCTPVISSNEAMQYIGEPDMYIATGPLGICVFADLEPELKSPIVAYLSDAAVCEWLKKGWLEAEDWLRAGALAVTTLAYAEAERRRTGRLPPLSPPF
jgi:hypothetical protein